jgi:hypothetical protein
VVEDIQDVDVGMGETVLRSAITNDSTEEWETWV